jgi:hypothetical protein
VFRITAFHRCGNDAETIISERETAAEALHFAAVVIGQADDFETVRVEDAATDQLVLYVARRPAWHPTYH